MVLKDWLYSLRLNLQFNPKRRVRRSLRRRKKLTHQHYATVQSLEQRQLLSGTNEPPEFDNGEMGYWWSVAEDTAVGSVIGTVSATDPESDSTMVDKHKVEDTWLYHLGKH